MFLFIMCLQARSSTKIVGGRGRGAKSRKNVGHYGWPMEKMLGFEWPKTTQIVLKFLFFVEDF